jgi:hypothetical protein
MGGATIIPRSLKTTRNEKKFPDRPNFFVFCKSYMIPKFDPLTATGMALCVNLGPKCQNLFCLVLD